MVHEALSRPLLVCPVTCLPACTHMTVHTYHTQMQRLKINKTNASVPHDPSSTLCCLPKGTEKHAHNKVCVQMLIAALSIIVKTWKQPKRPSAGEGEINGGTSL